jgi:transcriptional regulator with XRE-family HTH domain
VPPFQQLGPALRHLRQIRGKKQLEIAAEAEVTRGMLSSYENGHQEPTLTTLGKILDALGADLAKLQWAMTLTGSPLEPDRTTGEGDDEGGMTYPFPNPRPSWVGEGASKDTFYRVELPRLEVGEQEVFAHLVAAFLAYRRWRREGGEGNPPPDPLTSRPYGDRESRSEGRTSP